MFCSESIHQTIDGIFSHVSLSYFKIECKKTTETTYKSSEKLQKTAKTRKKLFTHPCKFIKHYVYFVFDVNCWAFPFLNQTRVASSPFPSISASNVLKVAQTSGVQLCFSLSGVSLGIVFVDFGVTIEIVIE